MNILYSCILIFWALNAFSAYKFEGLYNEPDGDGRFFLVRLFSPYNPTILAYNCGPDAQAKCNDWWPEGTFFTETEIEKGMKYDFVWIDSKGSELEILQSLSEELEKASAIYTTTHFFDRGIYYQNLLLFLELCGFAPISHWYWEGKEGHAIFLKKKILDAAMKTLHRSPHESTPFDYPSTYRFDPFFKKTREKSVGHSMDGIDFIYMINLDERPEKFCKAAGSLHQFRINPYRFSAVNGWNLSLNEIETLGVRCPSSKVSDTFLGSTYYEVNGVKYRSNQMIQEDGRVYFSLGLSEGSIGIVLSHLSVLQDAYDSGYKTIWVMEDDVEVLEDPWQIPELLRHLDEKVGDWDILFTDTDTKDTNGVHVPCRALAARPNFPIGHLDSFLQFFQPISPHISRIGMRYGAYSMIVRRSGMEKILNYFKNYGIFLPYDMDFWLIPGIKMYSVTKDIVSHAAGSLSDNAYPNYLKKK